MRLDGKAYFEGLEDKLQKLPFALSISDISLEDQPLVFINEAFTELTGYGTEALGQNCRFLQAGLEDSSARAEIRDTLQKRGRTQVVLQNRRKNGEMFYNLLLLECLKTHKGQANLALGSQFDLGSKAPHELEAGGDSLSFESVLEVSDQAQKLRIERRRILTDAAVRLVQSWCILNDPASP